MDIAPDSLYSSLANDTRLRSLMLQLRYVELCVCELTHALGLAQPHVSRHLALLRESGLVADRSPFVDDTQALAQMPNRPGAPRCA